MASSPHFLSEEQRQQALAKLLAERRAKSNNSQAVAALADDERAMRVQQLIYERTAAKLQQGGDFQSIYNF